MNIKNNKNCKITINDKEIAVSEKEKTADELFKELGYKKLEDKYNIDYNKIYSFTNGDKIKEQIRFCKLDKYIYIENYNFVVDKNCNKLTLNYSTNVTRLFYKQENNYNNCLEFYIKRVEVA